MDTDLRLKIETRLREAGFKVTPQRFAVLSYLVSSRAHPTADQISANLNKRYPRASRATIYNTLSALCDAGVVHEININKTVARYDANLEPHYHFVCRVCSKLEDIAPSTPSANTTFNCGLQTNYHIESLEIMMRGVCAACYKANKN